MNPFPEILNGKNPNRPPVWFMRQAGRILPEYQQLRQQYSFRELMETPQLACDVTLMPVNLLDTDAAILFSDILVIPQALGLDLEFTDKGPVFQTPLLKHSHPENALNPQPEKLEHIYQAIDLIINQKPEDVPLIGFCGGPLTVLLYMLEGLGTKSDFRNAESFIINNQKATEKIVETVTAITIEYARQQIRHGADCFRLFESNCGNIPYSIYNQIFLPSVKKVCAAVRALNRKFFYFAKGIGAGISSITPDVCDYISIDWQTDIYTARKLLHKDIEIEGNFEPRILLSSENQIETELQKYKPFAEENPKWIFNLGHGVLPDTPFENAKFFVKKAKEIFTR